MGIELRLLFHSFDSFLIATKNACVNMSYLLVTIEMLPAAVS